MVTLEVEDKGILCKGLERSIAVRVSIGLERGKFRIRHLGCDYKLGVMRSGFFLFFSTRGGGAADREIAELQASRLAHLQSRLT